MTMVKPDTSTTGKHIAALDGLRGVAILMVLMLHLLWANTNPQGGFLLRFFARAISAGSLGVDLFFALSGFLITGILYDTLHSSRFFRNFYARRTLRVFPLYYAFVGLVLAVSLSMGERWHAGLVGVLTYNIIQPPFPISDSKWVNLNHFWSLAVEEQFYLCWPVLVYFLRSKRRIAWAAVIGALVSFSIRCYIQWSGLRNGNPYLGYSWPPARLDALLFGSALAMLVRSQWRERVLHAAPVAFACGTVLLISYGIYSGSLDAVIDPWMQSVGLFCAGLTSCAAIAASLRRGSWFEGAMNHSVLRFFGRYSYGLYVMHYTITTAVIAVMRPWLLSVTHSKLGSVVGSGVVCLGLSLLAAVLSFHFFEQPILGLKRHFQDDSPTPKLRRQLAESDRQA
jgi:peptidoglycan/LPS O-acetylase OafA/YrhL